MRWRRNCVRESCRDRRRGTCLQLRARRSPIVLRPHFTHGHHRLSPLRSRLLLAATCAAVSMAAGCTSLFYGYVNRGLPPPDAEPVYAPELDLALDVYAPEAPRDEPAPVVVFFYGGSWQGGTRDRYRFVGRRLASNGIL